MRYVTRLACIAIGLGLALGASQPAFAGMSSDDRPDQLSRQAPETECDRLAASPYDPDRLIGIAGVEYNLLDGGAAKSACERAVAEYPDAPRFIYQAGRAALAQNDTATALEMYRKAAGMGYAPAMTGLCIVYNEGLGVPADADLGNSWCAKAVALGNPVAIAFSGFYLMQADAGRASERLEESAATGSPIGMTMLALYLSAANGDPHRVNDLLQRAADANCPMALLVVGESHKSGEYGFALDTNLWVSTITRAAELGDPSAQLELGKAYQDADIVFRDYGKARALYERAAKSHNLDATKDALRAIGKMYEEGLGVDKDIQVARQWYAKAYDFKPNESLLAHMMP